MQRRTLLKQMVILGTGVIVLPSCFRKKTIESISLKHLSIDMDQEALLAMVSETIIPKTDTLGSKELGLHLFVLKMMDDCTDKKTQEAFMNGLNDFNKQYGMFINQNQQERLLIIANLDKEPTASKDMKLFMQKMRQLTILGFTNSKYVMTELLPFQMIPGHFYGCVNKLNPTKKS